MAVTVNGRRIFGKCLGPDYDETGKADKLRVLVAEARLDKASAKDIDRPALQAMLDFVRQNDLVIVDGMDRLARSLDDLRCIVKDLTSRGVKIQFLKKI